MGVSELNIKLTQEIRELSIKKSKIQADISALSTEETKIRISVKKSTDTLTELEKTLAKLKADEQSSKTQIDSLESQVISVSETLSTKQVELESTLRQIAFKKEQAKIELKSFIDGSIEDTKRKCTMLQEEVRALKEQTTLDALLEIERANSQAEEILQSAIDESERKKTASNEYYSERVAKADTEYQDILKRASEKHSHKIQEAVNQLADLHDNIATKNSELKELMQNQERQITCLMDIESLLSERQTELDKINVAIVDGDNALGTMTDRESKRLVELESQLSESQQSEDVLKNLIEEIKLQHEQVLKVIQSEHESEITSLKFEIEKLSNLRKASSKDTQAYEEQLQSVRDEYDTKIAQLTIDLELANSLNFQIDLDNDDLQVANLTKKIETLEKKIAQEHDIATTLSTKLAKAMKTLQFKESQIKELAVKVVDMENERESLLVNHESKLLKLVNLEEELKTYRAEVTKLEKTLLDREIEIGALQEAKNLMSVNKKDYETVKDKFRELKNNYNVSVNNQLGIKSKVVELIITALIVVAASLYSFAFATGSQVYVGYLVIGITVLNLLWCCYVIQDKLSLAKDMKNTMEFN